jgi:signal peptidase II|tara:strand:- start:5038 stop:5532 length:495 start_codon:yes stop_codon:yes gene_type:complete
MNKLFLKKATIYFGIILFIFLADRISKLYILSILEDLGNVNININSYINLILVWNSGIGFGLLSFDQLEMYNLMTILIIFINLLIVYLIIKSKDKSAYFFLIILGGSLGNLFDRIYYSAVPDFIDISYKGYHWFVFNVADIFISLGIICLIFAELLNYKKKNEI